MTIGDAKDVEGIQGGRTDATVQHEAETREHEPKAVSEILPLRLSIRDSQAKKVGPSYLFDHNTTPCRHHN